MISLGLIGTVCGFLMMLYTAFANIDVSSTESLQDALGFMAMGMSTALSTTLVGLISSLHLKTQLVLVETKNNGSKQV
jgi:biopolymer transport protein ExbB/TolQ